MACNCDKDESNAADCNQECPTTCDTQTYVGTTCGCSPECGCMTSTVVGGTPFYNHAPSVEESHARVCLRNQYVTGVTISSSAIMPACNETTVLTIPGIQLINIGAYLWNPTYGYLKVISFDFANSLVEVENECQASNAAPGTVIPSCTAFTVVDTPIDNLLPCPEVTAVEGALLVCNDDAIVILEPDEPGQVPVSTVGNTVEFQTLDLPVVVCTDLSANLTILIGNIGPYTLTVVDSSAFTGGIIIELQGYAYRFIVNLIPGPTQINATLISGVPGATVVVPSGTAVCISDCCEQIDYWIEHPCDWDLSDRMYVGVADDSTPVLANGILLETESIETDQAAIISPNALCTDRLVSIDVEYKCRLLPIRTAAADEYATAIIYPKFAYTTGVIGGAIPPAPVSLQDYYKTMEPMNGATESYSFHYTYHENVVVAAGDEIRVKSTLEVEYADGDAAQINYYDLSSTIKLSLINV